MKKGNSDLQIEVERAEDILVKMKSSTMDLFNLFQCDPTPVYAVVGMYL